MAKVQPEDLEGLHDYVHENRADGDDADIQVLTVAYFHGVYEKPGADVIMAAAFRMEALARTVQHERFVSWRSNKQADGSVKVPAEIFKVAAKVHLVLGEREAHFDIDEFMNELLAVVEPHGNA